MELVALHKRVIGLDVHQAQTLPAQSSKRLTGQLESSNCNLAPSRRIDGRWPSGRPRNGRTKS